MKFKPLIIQWESSRLSSDAKQHETARMLDFVQRPSQSNSALLLASVVVLLTWSAPSLAAGPAPFGGVIEVRSDNWQFVTGQSDEFSGSIVDQRKWNIDPEDFGVWSWEPENVNQENGSLHLTIRQKTHNRGGQELDYVSGMAKNEKTITYGYFEAKIKGCSRYPGACPAFWLYSRGPNNRYTARDGETVAYSEIDIIELQQSEYDFETKKHFPVTHIDCNLHATLIRNGKRHWLRPHSNPEMCKTAYDAPWDPRDDFHVYAVLNTPEEIVWYIDGKEVGRKPNLYWHLPMHLTLSLGLRHPFVKYQDGRMVAVPEAKTGEGFPTSMEVDYVRVWQHQEDTKPRVVTDWTLAEYVSNGRRTVGPGIRRKSNQTSVRSTRTMTDWHPAKSGKSGSERRRRNQSEQS